MHSIISTTVFRISVIVVALRAAGARADELQIAVKSRALGEHSIRTTVKGSGDEARGRRTEMAAAFADKGFELLKKRQYRAALSALDKAVATDPQNTLAHLGRTQCLLEMRRNREAAEAIRDVIRLHPDESRYHSVLGSILFRTGDYHGATRSMTEAIRLGERDARAYRARAAAFYFTGDYHEFIHDCDEAIRLKPGDSSTHAIRAVGNARFGHYDLAVQDYDRAIALDPRNVRLRVSRFLAESRRVPRADDDRQIKDALAAPGGSDN